MFRLAMTVLPRHVFHLPVEMLYHTRLPVPERLTDAADDAYVGGMFSVQPDDAQSYDVTCQLLLTHETLNVSLYLLSLFIALLPRLTVQSNTYCSSTLLSGFNNELDIFSWENK